MHSWCGFVFLVSSEMSKQILISIDYMGCYNTIVIFGLWIMFCIKQPFIFESCKLMGSILRPLSHESNALTTVLPMWKCINTFASIAIQNVICIFNISSRNVEWYCRSWIEYLNERFNVCILERSIKLDTNNKGLGLFMFTLHFFVKPFNTINGHNYKSLHLDLNKEQPTRNNQQGTQIIIVSLDTLFVRDETAIYHDRYLELAPSVGKICLWCCRWYLSRKNATKWTAFCQERGGVLYWLYGNSIYTSFRLTQTWFWL